MRRHSARPAAGRSPSMAGFLEMEDRPDPGIALDEEVVERYRLP